MKNFFSLILILCCLALLSCQNKTVQLLNKKWDCVQVDNIVSPGTKFLSAQDSTNAIQLQTMLHTLSWTFKDNWQYACSIGSRITVQGSYQLTGDDGKTLILTSQSGNNINRYQINSLTENELVLSGHAANTNLVMHFRANQ